MEAPLSHSVTAPAALSPDEELLRDVQARGESGAPAGSNKTLLLTAALFVVLGAAQWGVKTVLFITVAVGLHELGHVIAMRLCGYKNVRMLFIPLFGGLATGQPRELDGTRNTLVALAGPAFGLLTSLAACLIAPFAEAGELWLEFASVSLFLNAFNLLPLYPLDGGMVTNETLFARFPWLELGFRMIAIIALAWLTVTLAAWLLGLLPLYLLLTAQVSFRRARLVKAARRDPVWHGAALDVGAVGRLRAMVEQLFSNVAPSKYAQYLPQHVHGLWLEIRKRHPGVLATVGLLVAYLLCVMAVFFVFGAHQAAKDFIAAR